MNRLLAFLRTVLPADPFQLLFLFGLVCLTIAPHLRWWPTYLAPNAVIGVENWQLWPNPAINGWHSRLVFMWYSFRFAVCAGYFLCFWPTKRRVSPMFLLVLAAPIVGIASVILKDLSLRAPFVSALGPKLVNGAVSTWGISDAWKIGSGVHFAVCGLLSIGIFLLRLALGKSSLPIRLSPGARVTVGAMPDWRGIQRLLWGYLSPAATLVGGAAATVLFALFTGIVPRERLGSAGGYIRSVLWTVMWLFFALFLAGKENRRSVRGMLRLPGWRFFVLGAIVPAMIVFALATGHYLVDRIRWAQHFLGRLDPPQFSDYFSSPPLWTLSMVVAAFGEELIFRGILQRNFVSRFGLMRGFFLVGTIWGATHFPGDALSQTSEGAVLVHLVHRMAQCIGMGFVLSWFTIRTGSIIPATLAHWISNVAVETRFDADYPGKIWIRTAFWALTAYLMFRYWPTEKGETIESHEPATPLPELSQQEGE